MRQHLARSAIVLSLVLSPTCALAGTSYVLLVRPAGTAALYSTLAFDVSHSDTACRNRVTFTNFTTEGHSENATVEAGPGYGDLLAAGSPAAFTTLEAQYFYNSLAVPFDSLKGTTTVRIAVSEDGPTSPASPDEFSMYLIDRNTGLPSPTADDLGTGALFAIDVTGASGGELTIFSPMVFVPPDTLALQGSVDDVRQGGLLDGRLRIARIIPTPAREEVRIDFVLPRPGGRPSLTLIDVGGRRVATIAVQTKAAGSQSAAWRVRDDHGHRIAPGVYFLKLDLGGQTAIRRLVINP